MTRSPSLAHVPGHYPKFIEAMKARLAKIKVGDGLAAGADTGPVSGESQLQQELNCIEIGQGVESIDAQ
jgi:acyl-CoA reductase-like NAD-dependent aldehyde dehydrogenase